MHAEGTNGSVTLSGDQLIIRRRGFANILTQGFQGEKAIPLRHVTAIQFRSAGTMMAGCIQFTIQGGREFRGGMLEATKDENAVLFERKQEPAFQQLRQLVQDAISFTLATGQSASASPTQQLAELADLVERGFLTREEFDAQKAKLLTNRPAATASISGGAIQMPSITPPGKSFSRVQILLGILIIMWIVIIFH